MWGNEHIIKAAVVKAIK